MRDETEPGPHALRRAYRVLAVIVISGLLLWALFTPVFHEREVGIFVGQSPTTSRSPTGLECLFPRWPPTGLGPLILLYVPGWGALIFTTRALILLASNRCEGALVACQWSLLLIIITIVVQGVLSAYAGLLLSPVLYTEEFRWGYSILIWLIGHGLLLEVSWIGGRSGIPQHQP